jgi:hypothetical protein
VLAIAAIQLWGGGTATWETSTYADFIRGRFSGVSLTRDGRLILAPRPVPVLTSSEVSVWSVVAGKDGTLYAGTGHKGKVFAVDRAGKSQVIWTAPQPEVFALALDPQDVLYAATSPDGRIYRLAGGQATEFANPGAKYVWALAFAADGTLYAGTGDQGKVLRIGRDGVAETWYETGQSHVTGLALDARGRILAGTEPNGILYRVETKGKAFVLYDSSLPEIRSILAASDGSLYVSALGGSLARQNAQAAMSAAAASPLLPTLSTTITVTSESAQAGLELKPKPEAAKPATPTAPAETVAGAAQVIDMTGLEKSAIYHIYPDNSVETLWSSKEENVFDLALRGQELLFSTDLRGRIYRLSEDLKAALLLETKEGETTRLLETPAGLVAGTSNVGKLFRLEAQAGASGTYESPVHDANTVARWGRLAWRGDIAKTAKLSFRTRAGNSARPDSTWSEWSAPLTGDGSAQISSPPARFIQWSAELAGGGEQELAIDSVAVNYLPQNNRPIVRGITVTPQWTAVAQKTTAAQAPQPASYSITVTDTGEASTATSTGTPTHAITRSGTPQMMIAWQADDPDGDKLVYSLWFRGEEEKQWKLVKDQLTENTHLLDAETLADGRYLFRVQASDRQANAAPAARDAELVSAPVMVDNTPPVLTMSAAVRTGASAEVQFTATDSMSPLRRAEYAIDAGPWALLEPSDGILDDRTEQFTVRLSGLAPGEHVVVVRVFDSSNNPGLAKAVLR